MAFGWKKHIISQVLQIQGKLTQIAAAVFPGFYRLTFSFGSPIRDQLLTEILIFKAVALIVEYL
jgi:hypothetical protein